MLSNRDYELISIILRKNVQSVDVSELFRIKLPIVCRSYRSYNVAYFEEILLMYNVDERIAKNYRERFIITPSQVFEVLHMYSKMDYVIWFLKQDVSGLSNDQLLHLFLTCFKNDAMKVALHLYKDHLPVSLIDHKVLD